MNCSDLNEDYLQCVNLWRASSLTSVKAVSVNWIQLLLLFSPYKPEVRNRFVKPIMKVKLDARHKLASELE